jgi:hypothetical protein
MFFFSWLDAAYYQRAHSPPFRVHRLGFNFRVILMGDSAMGSHWASHSACEIGFLDPGKVVLFMDGSVDEGNSHRHIRNYGIQKQWNEGNRFDLINSLSRCSPL